MRSLRLSSLLLVVLLVTSVAFVAAPYASAQSVSDAENEADEARNRAEAATGLVDEAVAERASIEQELAATISRLNDLSAELSRVGTSLDRIAEQLGFADVELAGIQTQIEVQAVDAYMTVVGSPTFSLINSETVEEALVASSVVGDVVASGRETVDELVIKREDLEELQASFLESEAEFASIQEVLDLNAEAENLTALYERADTAVAAAIRDADAAAAEYLAALSSVELARAREAERKRQEERSTTTTSSGTATTGTPTTSGTSPTTSAPSNTTTSTTGGGGGGPWNHPPAVEQWRSLVTRYFPSNRVEEALRIIDCESNGDPDAVNPYSNASGLFQFLPSTWASTAPKAGWGGYSVFNPEANVASAAWLANRYEELGNYYWRAWSCRRVLN